MNDVFSIILFMMMLSIILLTIAVALMKCAINDLKKEVEQHRARFNYLEFDYSSISDIEDRLDKLEELLELKEFYEQEPLNK